MTLGSHITEGFGSADQIINRVIDGVTNTGYTFNPRGDRTTATTAGVTTSYGYDQANHLTSYTPPAGPATTYAYNGQGLRTAKTTSGAATSYTWDTAGSLPLMLTAGTTSYIYGPDHLPIESIDGSGTPTYLLHDQLGSTRLLVSQAGDVTGTYTYDAWGNTTSHTGTATTPLQYTGQYLDNETGFYYLRNRYYDPLTAQFLTIDPLVAQTRATYTYTGNNPITSTDPTGLLNEPVGQSCNPEDQYCAKDARYPCHEAGIGCRRAAPVSQIAGAIAKSAAVVAGYSLGIDLAGSAAGAAHALSVRVSAWLATLGATTAVADNSPEDAEGASGGIRVIGSGFSASERSAAEALAGQGRNVVLREATGVGRTSDLLVDGVPYDVYTPTTGSLDRIVSAIASKGSQVDGGGIVLDLSKSPLAGIDPAALLARVQGVTGNISDIIILGG